MAAEPGVPRQASLPGPGLADDHQRPAQTPANRCHQIVERRAVSTAADQHVRSHPGRRRFGAARAGPLAAIACAPAMAQHTPQDKLTRSASVIAG
jgi:hypothetical protein